MLSQNSVSENLSVVLKGERQILGVDVEELARFILRFDLICGEENSLAKEVGHDVVRANELHLPL